MPIDLESDSPLSRRERRRLATHAEVVATAREQLRLGQDVSIRAVATEMGVTAPALYRYVESAGELRDLVRSAVLEDVVDTMAVARDAHPDSEPELQIAAVASAYRTWALAHPAEFQHVFSTPPPAGDVVFGGVRVCEPGTEVDDRHLDAGEKFGEFFGEIFGRLWLKRPFPVPSRDELHPAFVTLCDEAPERQRAILDQVGPDAYGMLWVFRLAWARLYGIVTLEVAGQIDRALIETGAVFDAMLIEIGESLGMFADPSKT